VRNLPAQPASEGSVSGPIDRLGGDEDAPERDNLLRIVRRRGICRGTEGVSVRQADGDVEMEMDSVHCGMRQNDAGKVPLARNTFSRPSK
jgi:hypothetical protein